MTCSLCGRDPVEGGSFIDELPVCHPERGPRVQALSCFEVVAYVLVEHHPRGLRPPVPIPVEERERARAWIAQHR